MFDLVPTRDACKSTDGAAGCAADHRPLQGPVGFLDKARQSHGPRTNGWVSSPKPGPVLRHLEHVLSNRGLRPPRCMHRSSGLRGISRGVIPKFRPWTGDVAAVGGGECIADRLPGGAHHGRGRGLHQCIGGGRRGSRPHHARKFLPSPAPLCRDGGKVLQTSELCVVQRPLTHMPPPGPSIQTSHCSESDSCWTRLGSTWMVMGSLT